MKELLYDVAQIYQRRALKSLQADDLAHAKRYREAAAEIERLTKERDEWQQNALKMCGREDEIVLAMPLDYLDPPDGGDVSLGEQVKRMREHRDELKQQLTEQQAHNAVLREALVELYEYASPWNHIESASCKCDPDVDYVCSGCHFANSEIALNVKAVLTSTPAASLKEHNEKVIADFMEQSKIWITNEATSKEMRNQVREECAYALQRFSNSRSEINRPNIFDAINQIRAMKEE